MQVAAHLKEKVRSIRQESELLKARLEELDSAAREKQEQLLGAKCTTQTLPQISFPAACCAQHHCCHSLDPPLGTRPNQVNSTPGERGERRWQMEIYGSNCLHCFPNCCFSCDSARHTEEHNPKIASNRRHALEVFRPADRLSSS